MSEQTAGIVIVGTPYRIHGFFNVDISGALVIVHYTPPSPELPSTWTGEVVDGATGEFLCNVTDTDNLVAGSWLLWAEAILDAHVLARTYGARLTVEVTGYVP